MLSIPVVVWSYVIPAARVIAVPNTVKVNPLFILNVEVYPVRTIVKQLLLAVTVQG